jgi:hypothetical protein
VNARSVDEADTALAAQVWLDSPDASFIIRSGMSTASTRHLMRETFSKRRLSPRDVAVMSTEIQRAFDSRQKRR